MAQSYAQPGPEHGPDDEWRHDRELVEAGRDVAGGAHDAREQNDHKARGDGGLQAQSEAKYEQGNYHYPASSACETGEHAAEDAQTGQNQKLPDHRGWVRTTTPVRWWGLRDLSPTEGDAANAGFVRASRTGS